MKRKINNKVVICEISITNVLICRKLGSIGSVHQNLSCLRLNNLNLEKEHFVKALADLGLRVAKKENKYRLRYLLRYLM